MTRVLIVGLGSIGRRHARILEGMDVEVAVCRRSEEAAEATVAELGLTAYPSLAAAEAFLPDAVIVATPTSEHLAGARWALEHGSHVLVEKPLSHTLDGVSELVALAAARSLVLAVGCNLRFHPALTTIRDVVLAGRLGRVSSVRAEVGSFLPDWHPDEDYRLSYAARADLGGGALLTLVHELDAVLWLLGAPVWSSGVRRHVSALELDVDDVAEVVCVHAGGALSSVHMDFLDRAYNRRLRVVGELATAEWVWGGPAVLLDGGDADVLWDDPGYDLDASYRAELDDFLACIRSGARPRADGRDGELALEVAATVREVAL